MSGTTFVPESGLTTQNNVNVQANTAPRRTAPGITAPPAVVKEADRMSEELSALGNSIDSQGHPVGRYHSFFHELLTWKHPRASGLILTTLLSTIVFTQFVNVPKFAFRILWIALASSTALEVAGRFVFRSNEGLVAQIAPKEYFTISRESLDPIFNEMHSLANFAVTEFQRLLFVRNVQHTSVAFVLSFVAYNFIKFLPLWALTMIGIVLAFALPPIYLHNQKAIDAHINKASEMGSVHFNNAKEVASKHATAASEKARLTAIDLGNKAGVDVHKYISGPGPVQSQSVLDNLAQQPKTTTATTTSASTNTATLSNTAKTETSSFSTPIADEFSRAPAVPSSDGVHVSGEKLSSDSHETIASSLPKSDAQFTSASLPTSESQFTTTSSILPQEPVTPMAHP